MCGICGQFNYSDDEPVSNIAIEAMTGTMTHRGPDDSGYHYSGGLGLGFRRLSIIDLGGGHQPMSDRDGRIWVVFNGEIYNFKDIRRELEAFGHHFRTKSDTEVIVHGYQQWGDDVLSRLNGMFGLGIWDQDKRRLLLARDRMGIKPVYYTLDSGRLLFGSEIRPVLSGLGRVPDFNPAAIEDFLLYRYSPAPATILKGVQKLAAGTCLIAQSGCPVQIKRWWKFAPRQFDPLPSDRQAEDALLSIYSDAVRRHLISDVPVGLLLSGGIDSGLLLGMMSESHASWNTYSVGFGDSYADDELRDAASTAHLFGSHHEPVHLTVSDFESSLEKIVALLEEPVATCSIVPLYFVCQRARDDVKVALIGQGPDELFGGYIRHLGAHYGKYWRHLPDGCRSSLKHLLTSLPTNEAVKRALHSLDVPDRLTRYQRIFALLPPTAVRGMFRSGILCNAPGAMPHCWDELSELMRETDELGGLQFLEVRSSLPDELLLYADKLSMAHNLELRVPYLDQQVVEYAERLPASFKVRNGTRKWLHRRVAGAILPGDIMNRRKRGFATNVVDSWFRNSLSKTMEDMLSDPQSLIYTVLDQSAVITMLREHQTGHSDHHKTLFSFIVLEHLLRGYHQWRPSLELR